MTGLFAFLAIVFLGLFIAAFIKSQRVQKSLNASQAELATARNDAQAALLHYQSELSTAKANAQAEFANSKKLVEQQVENLREEAERIRQHYESEALKSQQASEVLLSKTLQELESLRRFASLKDAEIETREVLAEALEEAKALRMEANTLLEQARLASSKERSDASQRAKGIRQNADALLDRATREAGRIVEEATKRAEQIGGDAYIAMRDKETLEKAVRALWNVAEGYGDRYVIPSRSLIDDLASDFGHTEAGEALKHAREQSIRMVEEKQAATCNYVENDRRERAIRFTVDAFNGRVDAILTRTKHDNYGTLEQEIRDAYALVNLNGIAFRDARVLPTYLDARLAELKWAVIVQELKMQAREEQRRIQEQIREEEKVRREQERAIKEAQDKEDAIKKALEKARTESEHANAQERAKFDAQIAQLTQRLSEAEAVKRREISLAQLTRAGNVYIISNLGAFGEDVFKIGMTRRRDPMDRIWELSDASVPFDFDVHAMIYSEDAPALERMLHQEFDDLRINKVNCKKEFFKLPLERIKTFVTKKNFNASFTMLADAHEYRETKALEKMTPEEREKYHLRRTNDEVCDVE